MQIEEFSQKISANMSKINVKLTEKQIKSW